MNLFHLIKIPKKTSKSEKQNQKNK